MFHKKRNACAKPPEIGKNARHWPPWESRGVQRFVATAPGSAKQNGIHPKPPVPPSRGCSPVPRKPKLVCRSYDDMGLQSAHSDQPCLNVSLTLAKKPLNRGDTALHSGGKHCRMNDWIPSRTETWHQVVFDSLPVSIALRVAVSGCWFTGCRLKVQAVVPQ